MGFRRQGQVVAAVVVLAASSIGSGVSRAAEWPARPVSLVVPYTAGSVTDIIARVITTRLAHHLGQPVNIDYRPGQATAIGTRYVAKAPADGYAMIMQGATTVAVAPLLNPDAGYTLDDFDSVATVGFSPLALVVRADLPAKNVADLVSLAKTKSDGLTYAAAGNGSIGHLATSLFSRMSGLNQKSLLMIPYKGSADALIDLIGGRVDIQISVLAPMLGAIRKGQVRILGVSSATRQAVLPDAPTIMEAGIPGYDVVSSLGMLVRRGTPAVNIRALNLAFNNVLGEAEIRSQLALRGIEAAQPNPPQAFGNEIRGDAAKYGPVIRDFGIKATFE